MTKPTIADLKAANKRLREENENLKSGHFCPSPQLGKLATACDCVHSDRHRAIDWASIETLKAENKQLREALQVIARPQCDGYVWTSQDAEDTEHCNRLLKYINAREPENIKTLAGTPYQLMSTVAEEALKE